MNSIPPHPIRPAVCRRRASRAFGQAAAGLSLIFLTGCRGAPSLNLLGSFFPAWMLCMILGVAGAFVVRVICVRTGVEPYMQPRLPIYLCLWGLITLLLWLSFFRS